MRLQLMESCCSFQGIHRNQETAGPGRYDPTNGAGVPSGEVPVQDGGGRGSGYGNDYPQLGADQGGLVLYVEGVF